MEDFNEYAGKRRNENQSGNSSQQNLFGLINSLAGKFDGKSQGELLAAIYREAKAGKEKGTLSNADIDSFVNMISPFLDDKKRGYLNKIAKDLKKI